MLFYPGKKKSMQTYTAPTGASVGWGPIDMFNVYKGSFPGVYIKHTAQMQCKHIAGHLNEKKR